MNYFGGFEYSLWEDVVFWLGYSVPFLGVGALIAFFIAKNRKLDRLANYLMIATIVAAFLAYYLFYY